jgi:hypothetical protein
VAIEINTPSIGLRDNAHETRESPSFGGIPGFWWDWPDEAQLTAFAEQSDQVEQTDRTLENNLEYATLYFVS